MTGKQVIDSARAMIGTPFLHQGRIPGVALDCAGLVVAVARQLGFDPVDVAGYSRTPFHGQLESHVAAQSCLEEVPLPQIAPGAIVVMRFTKEPQHLAIYAGDTIIHSYETVGQVCEHALSSAWRARIVRAFCFVGVSNE